jgi:hypothetical protein
MPMIFYVLDLDWKFAMSEGQGLLKLGLRPGQVVGLSAKDMYKDYPDILAGIERSFQGEAVQIDHVFGDLYLGNYIVPLYNSVGKIDGIAGATIDSVPGILYLYHSDGRPRTSECRPQRVQPRTSADSSPESRTRSIRRSESA